MRWILRIVGAVAVAALLAVGALVAVPTERVAGLVTDRLSAATGREVVIDGAVRPTLWPSLGVRAEGLRIGNPDWVEAGPLLQAESLHVSVEWAPLLQGEVRLDRAELIGPDITLVRAADGRVSWDFAGAPAPAGESSAAEGPETPAAPGGFAIGFERAEVRNARLRWIDEATGQDISVSGADAVLSLPSGTGPAGLTVSAELGGAELELAAEVDGAAAFLDGQVRPATLSLGWPGGTASFEGRLALAPALDGRFEIDATDFGPLLWLAGLAMPDLPRGLGRDRIAASGQITLPGEGTVHLRQGGLTLDDNILAAELDLLPGEDRPLLRGTIVADSLALAAPAASGGGTGGGSAGAAQEGWSRDRIDVSGLFGLDAELALRAGRVDLGTAEVAPVEVNATLDRGRLVFDIGSIGAYGGRLAGQFVVNGRNGLSVGGDLILAGVQLNPLLSHFADFDRLEGTGNASLQFLGVGNDLATIMSGLEGQGDMAFGAGAVLGFDLAGMIRNFDASFRGEGARTVYDSVTANFSIADGVLTNDDLELDAPWGAVRGEGTVDLGAQRLDYRVIPGVMRDENGQVGIEVPVLIDGPWSDLRFRPDLEYLAEQEFLEQRDRLAAEAQARLAEEQDRIEQDVRDRANELLGTQIEAGDTREEIEGALTDRLTEEAGNALLRLLGGGTEQAGDPAATEADQ
ncbi:AsmA family protein [Roseibacterium sp. SDUM158016]|uniref:AsmA family protein n=1 Tax=Roseicyclus sediminis TaxID=2980997 RepID=UPI0021CFC2ED|nr:AsmA family protein [Roseibacterium sp. SDUM158016]MCU4655114.1 AsmA family protein [Roseibacterium sp. SDUM158016]